MHRRIILALLVLSCILVIVYVYLKLNKGRELTENRTVLAGPQKTLSDNVVRLLAPAVATSEDWARLKVTQGTISDTVKFWSLAKMRAVLECETNTTAFHISAQNIRDKQGNISTSIYGAKVDNTLNIRWNSGIVQKEVRNWTSGTGFGETHPDQRSKQGANILLLGGGISISNELESGERRFDIIPFDKEQFSATTGFICTSHPIAALPLIEINSRYLRSILLVDTTKLKVVGNIKLPSGALSGQPFYMLDTVNDVLLVVQFQLDWLIAIDLQKYRSASEAKK